MNGRESDLTGHGDCFRQSLTELGATLTSNRYGCQASDSVALEPLGALITGVELVPL